MNNDYTTTGPHNENSRKPENIIVEEYFNFLCNGRHNAIITLCCMDSNTAKPVKGYACVNVRANEAIALWNQANNISPGCTLHVTLNETNLNGRRTEHMTSARCICVDIDEKLTPSKLAEVFTDINCNPHLLVVSSPGKYHLYFSLSSAIPLDRWQKYQIGFAEMAGGDKALSHPTALIRVPGFWRRTKEGDWFLPNIQMRDDDIPPFIERELTRRFPWLPKAIVEGTKHLEQERRKAGELARKLWKERGQNSSVLAKELGKAPSAGRNVTLYMVLRGWVFECTRDRVDLNVIEVLKKANELNDQFKCPLGAAEVRKTAFSAWRRGTGAGEAWNEKADYLECQEKKLPERRYGKEKNKEEEEKGSNGHDKEKDSLLRLLVAHEEELPEEERLQEIPRSKEEITDKLCRFVWREDKKDAAKALASALKTKNYNLYATWFIEKFKTVGCFRRSGPAVFICGKNRWGKDIYYAERLSKEAFLAFVGRTVTKIGRKCLGHPTMKRIIKKLPSQSATKGISEAVWAAGLLQGIVEKQSPEIIVFQNGVLDLQSGEFRMDRLAPIKYSHPLWCNFDLETARIWLDSERERLNRASKSSETEKKSTESLRGPEIILPVYIERNWKVIESKVPKFLKYMEDWFPEDSAAVELVLRWFGYSFTTDVSRSKFSFFYGPTRAGKGSICRTFAGIAGDVNYSVSDYNALDGGFRAANMIDKLLICIEEVEGTQKEHEKRMGYLKKLLGGEKVTVERKFEQPYEDRVCGKFVLQSNEMLGYQDKGHALRARMLCLGFEKSFEGEAGRDPADVILGAFKEPGESEGDSLGTLAALTWWAIRGEIKNDVFSRDLLQCRALEVGREEVIAGLDLYEYAIGRYLEYGASGKDVVLRSTISQLIELVCEEKGYPAVGLKQQNQGVKIAVQTAFPACKEASKMWDKDKKKWKSCRGYSKLRVKISDIERDFGDVLEASSGRFGELKRILGINDANSFLNEI